MYNYACYFSLIASVYVNYHIPTVLKMQASQKRSSNIEEDFAKAAQAVGLARPHSWPAGHTTVPKAGQPTTWQLAKKVEAF